MVSENADSVPFSYELPDERIAQRPVKPYDAARMLVVDPEHGTIRDSIFRHLPEFVRSEDLFVFNDTKVVPARLYGTRDADGLATELLILKPLGGPLSTRWECLGKPLKRLSLGSSFTFGNELKGRISSVEPTTIEFSIGDSQKSILDLLDECGRMPIPPYIRKGISDEDDRVDYQSRFARNAGSVAAPTASLHFTEELVSSLKAKGCGIEFLTLHLSRASFAPLWREDESAAQLVPPGGEILSGSPALLQTIQTRRRAGGRVIAVGTSVVRSLETISRIEGWKGEPQETKLFIRPPFSCALVDCVITNFHQPRTTHLLLVEALLGKELLKKSYEHALNGGYRFLSYGDGMFINLRKTSALVSTP